MVKIYEEGQLESKISDEKISQDESKLDKYIHLTDENVSQNSGENPENATNNRNYLIYTLIGVDNDVDKKSSQCKKKKKTNSPKSSEHHPEGESKLPRTSALFSFVSKLKKNRMEGKQIQQSTEILLPPKNIDLKTSSKIPVHLKRLQSKVNLKNTSSFCTSVVSTLPNPLGSISAGTSHCSSTDEVCLQTSTFSNGSTVDLLKCKEETINVTAPSYVETKSSLLNNTISCDIQEVTEQINKLEDNEKYVCDILSKYINDQSFKIELKESVNNYIQLHVETERKARSLSHKIWEQQIELHKNNEVYLKHEIDKLVKKNRKLGDENEALNKKNEMLSLKTAAMENAGSYAQRNSYVVEGLNRANDNLRMKLSAAKIQIETLDNKMHQLKERNNTLEDQINNCNSQLIKTKDILRRSLLDNDLELNNLYSEIKNKKEIIKKNFESVNILVEELNNLRTGVQCISGDKNKDWSQINKNSNENLFEVVNFTRACLDDLQNELQSLETDKVEKEKELKRLVSEHASSIERIAELDMQCENLKQKLKQKEELIINNFDTEETVKQLKQTLQAFKSEMELKNGQIREWDEKVAVLCAEKEDSDNQVDNLSEQARALCAEREDLQKDNAVMKLQLQELNSLLFTTGTANMTRDLKIAQDQLALLHEKCAELEMDKKSLKDQIHQQELDRQSLTIYQDNCYTYFQELQKEVEKITLNNEMLKTTLDDKKSEITALVAERKRNIEEKEVLKQIYEKLKSETTKVVKLEGTVTNINKEAVRLAKIADYNKQLGEKLKCDVVERDEEINKLKGNLDKLNEIQVENVKEKVSLCEELTEICNWKDLLDNKLAVEVQRNMMLAEYRNEIENTAGKQIELIEEKYLKQSNELDMLADKYRLIEAENKQFKTQLQIKEEKMLSLETQMRNYSADCEIVRDQLDEAKSIIADRNVKIDGMKDEIHDVSSKLEFQTSSNQKIAQDLQMKIFSDSEELENMDRTIQYLQNNMQKMQNDIDKSRENQKEQDLIFEKEKHKNEVLQLTLEQKLKVIEDFENERQKEMRKIDSLTVAYNKLSAEYEEDIKIASNEQKIEKEKFDTLKQELIEKKCDIKNLKEKIEEISDHKMNLQEECAHLQKQIQEYKDLTEEVENKALLLSERNAQQYKILTELENEKKECEKLKNKYNELKKKTEYLRRDLHNSEKCIENQKTQFKVSFDELEIEFHSQKDIMYKDLVTMHDRVKEISTDYVSQRNSRVKYEEAHKALAEKLLKSVKMLVEEKISRQTSENKILELTEKNAYLQKDQNILREKADEMKESLDELKQDLKEEHCKYKAVSKKYNDEKLKMSLGNVQDQDSVELKKLIEQISSSVLPMVTSQMSNEGISPASASRHKSKLLTKLQTYKVSLEKSHKKYMRLQEELGALQEKYTVLEFQKSEMVLRLHETQVRLGVHENMVLELKEINRNVLTLVLQMREDCTLDRPAAETLIFLMRS